MSKKLVTGGRVALAGKNTKRLQAIHRVLAGSGLEIVELSDDEVETSACGDFHPDIVIFISADLEDIKCLQRHYPHKMPYVFVMHDAEATGKKEDAIKKGVDEFLTWPIDPAELNHRISKAIMTRRRFAEVCENSNRLESALDTIRSYNTAFSIELEEARAIQHFFSPCQRFVLNGFAINFIIRPAQKLCGDFIDIIRIDESRVAMVLIDVSGHGAAAAMITGMTHAWLHSHLYENISLDILCTKLHRYLLKFTPESMYATAFIGILDTESSSVEYVLAGHPEPVMWKDGTCKPLPEADTPPFGLYDDFEPVIKKCNLSPGNALLVYSDGLMDGYSDFEDPLQELCNLYSRHNKQGCLRNHRCSIVDDVMRQGHATQDDMSILCISRFMQPLRFGNLNIIIPCRDHYEFTFSSVEESLRDLQFFLVNNVKESMDEGIFWDLLQVVGELVKNAMEWGNNFNSEKHIFSSIAIDEKEIKFVVEDQGEGFSLNGNCRCMETEKRNCSNSEDKRPGGLGLLLCKKLADRLEVNEKGNRISAYFKKGTNKIEII